MRNEVKAGVKQIMKAVACLSSLLLLTGVPPAAAEGEETISVTISEGLDCLEPLIEKAMKKSGTPGVSLAVVTPEKTRYRNYGYADQERGIPAESDTLFEIGSMSKAFTALGILLLEQEGKLRLTDDIRDYIPWLTMRFEGNYKGRKINGEVPLTVGNFLYQTTGVPFKTIGGIPTGGGASLLEETVRTLVDVELDFYPGTRFSYATINYDVLGLVIQTISGQSYEKFITQRIIEPLGLHHTYVGRQEDYQGNTLARGYKPHFFSTKPYDAPEYRGNTPAGYVISSAEDMARWMRIQSGWEPIPLYLRAIIEKSHVGDSTVASSGDTHYAAGWSVHIRGESISHGGSNPNYASMLTIDNEKQIGICVLSNLDNNVADYAVESFFKILSGEKTAAYKADNYKTLDTVFSCIGIGAAFALALYTVLFILAVVEIARKKRQREKLKRGKVAGLLLAVPIMIFFCYCVYYLPNILFSRLPWEAVKVWGSASIPCGCLVGSAAGILFFLYVLLTFNYPKQHEKNYMALVPLALINGLTSALIIFTINESFNRNLEYSKELLVYFLFALSFFVYTNKLVQGRLIVMTNEIAYEKRMNMIDRIVHSSYQAIEKIGGSRIYSGLNNDVSAMSQIPGMVIGLASNLLTLIFCMAYLLSNSVAAFLASLFVILLNAFISFLTSRIASRYWERNRDIQDVYFGQMSDLVYGFKELLLSKRRRLAFWQDINRYSRLSTELSKEASVKFLNFGIYNTLMYNLIFGVVVFLFPLIIIGISVNGLRETLFMVFYLIGPFGGLIGTIPGITQLRVHIKRINTLIKDLEEVSTCSEEGSDETAGILPPASRIRLQDVGYDYMVKEEGTNEERKEFTLGPVSVEIKQGEITYIVGGNGSGKSTLGKILTGLYKPARGRIQINGAEASLSALNTCFSAVYSDFHLFKKLYGVDVTKKEALIRQLLKDMKIDRKVSVEEDGAFTTLNLSTGQKKRLAYVICCLDDKPFMLFDEWAAEQDPEFRQYFYTVLLPKLKEQGKGVVVITHDDRYFDLADKLIKLEYGKMMEETIS